MITSKVCLAAVLAISIFLLATFPAPAQDAANQTPIMPALRGLETPGGETAAKSADTLKSQATMQEKAGAGLTGAKQNATVESYFNCGPNRDTRGARMQPSTVSYSPDGGREKKAHGFFWHLLDNMGVPMFGSSDLEIDPSIQTVSVIPPPKLPSERSLVRDLKLRNQPDGGITATAQPQATPPNTQPAQQKIPESELEGTIYETPAAKDMQAPAN